MGKGIRQLLLAAGVLAALGSPAWASETIKPKVSAAAEGSHIFCTSSCFLRSLYVTAGAASGFLMSFNATSAPADGAVTPIECVSVPAGTTVALDFGTTADPYNVGLVAVFSTTGCFSKTISATAFFKGRVQ